MHDAQQLFYMNKERKIGDYALNWDGHKIPSSVILNISNNEIVFVCKSTDTTLIIWTIKLDYHNIMQQYYTFVPISSLKLLTQHFGDEIEG